MGALARKSLKRMARSLVRKAVPAAADAARRVVSHAGASGAEGVLAHARELPIQRSVDVAVPVAVAWDEWMKFDHFPEGTHRLRDVHRDGDHLYGTLAGPTSSDWEAEVIEERQDESFAWRTVDGSDCVGLITFHQLGRRLTRLELISTFNRCA